MHGVSLDSPIEAGTFADQHNLAIPVIAEASGPVVDLFPRDIAPVTWLIIDQKPKLVYYGKLYPDHLEAIRAALNSLQNLPDSPE